MEQARELLGQGQVAAAQALLEQQVRQAEQLHGASSFEAAVARAQVGALMLALGDSERAIAWYRGAVGWDPGQDAERARRLLTMQNELALTLERAGHATEAEQVYLDVLSNREAFYGRAHPGYAFGLLPYASFLARQGQLDRALPLAQEANENLDQNQHPKLADVLLLMAHILVCKGHAHPFGAMAVPDELMARIATSLVSDEEWPPGVQLAVIESFVREAPRRLGERSDELKAALVAAVHAAREAGSLGAQRQHIGSLIELTRARGEAREVQHLTMALSLVAEKDGNLLDAERLLRDGVRMANELDDARARCHALRQLGTFEVQQKRPEGENVLRRALLEAIAADVTDEANLTRVALGVYLQHGGRLDEARELLTEAIAGLDPATNQAFTARSHLDAIRDGGGCGCGRGEQAYQATLESLVRPELPDGLLESIELHDGEISVQLSREPTDDEAALLDRVLRQALFRLRQAAKKS